MIVGIDLGTTNSLVGVWKDGAAALIPNALGQTLTPSCVSFDDNGTALVGAAARERLITAPTHTAASFKRYMGTNRRLTLGGKEFRPEELSALVLKSLKADAEAFLGQPVTEAVITVPAYFNDTQRKATRIAGELAGLKVERLLNEPTAAALAYGLHHAEPESQFLVFDLGGGTFDVSILELFSGVMEVRATAGDNFLGGEDFVDVLIDAFLDKEGPRLKMKPKHLRHETAARLRAEGERVKRELSSRDEAVFCYKDSERAAEWPVTQARFEQLCGPLLERLRVPVERALRDARLNSSALSRIVLVGGATRMPVVHRLVARLFGRFPNREIHPDEAIALGAAVQAGLKMRDAALDEVVMTDVAPYSLGVDVTEEFGRGQLRAGIFLPIIERNTVIPCSRVERVSSIRDYQPQVEVKVYQGESRNVQDNILLGSLKVPLPSGPRADQQVDIRFSYDINGLLEVETKVVSTGAVQKLVIEQSPGAMTRQEIDASLALMEKLKVHPRDQAENRALQERLKRLYEENLGERRAWVGHQIAAFDTTLESQDPRAAEKARDTLSKILDEFEASPLS